MNASKRLATGLVLSLLASCGAKAPNPSSPDAVAKAGAELRYEVTIEQNDVGRLELAVSATLPPQITNELSVTEGAEPFVKDFAVAPLDGRGFADVPETDGSWLARQCERGCRIRYRFLLDDVAREVSDDGVAMNTHGIVESPPAAWLVHPLRTTATMHIVFHVTSHVAGVTMATGVRAATPDVVDTYETAASDLRIAPYTVFGSFRESTVDVGQRAHVRFAVAAGKMKASDADLAKWIARAGHAVSDYYGRFPIDQTLIVVIPSRGDRVGFGRTMAGGGASILIDVGHDAGDAALAGDWVAVHEMIHLAYPSMGRQHAWIEEGLATYLEPFVRVRAGMTDEKTVWSEFVRMLPNGLPHDGSQGLERTPSWGSVYWGGALFCFVADLQIREKTNGERSLDDAVKNILASGGDDNAR
ncbi:MAG: hypothetical protein ABI551_06685, partial [Polyangiaceae bacterium]